MSISSYLKERFSRPRLMILLGMIVILIADASIHYNQLFRHKQPIIKHFTRQHIEATVKSDRISFNGQESSFKCYHPYCGLNKEGKYILSEIKLAMIVEQNQTTDTPIYYLMSICLNKHTCFDNAELNKINEKYAKIPIETQIRIGVWVLVIISIIISPYGFYERRKSEVIKEIERKYKIK